MNKYKIEFKTGDLTVNADEYVIAGKFITFYKDKKIVLDAKIKEVKYIWNISLLN